jgi:hypothetical protein
MTQCGPEAVRLRPALPLVARGGKGPHGPACPVVEQRGSLDREKPSSIYRAPDNGLDIAFGDVGTGLNANVFPRKSGGLRMEIHRTGLRPRIHITISVEAQSARIARCGAN